MKQLLALSIITILSFQVTVPSQNLEWKHYTNGDWIQDIEIEGEIIWVLTDTELVEINTISGNTIFHNLTQYIPNKIFIDGDGNKWIVNRGGDNILKFDGTNWTIELLDHLPDNVDGFITFDKEWNMWFNGRFRAVYGLIKYDGSKWISYDHYSTPGFPASLDINCLKFDQNGILWMGVDYLHPVGIDVSNGVVTFDGTNWSAPIALKKNVTQIEFYGSNQVWIGTERDGIIHYNGLEWNSYTSSNSGLPYNDIQLLRCDGGGNLWIVSKNCVTKFDGDNWIVYNNFNLDLNSFEISDIEIDDDENLWLGLHDYFLTGGGLYRFNGSEIKNINTSSSGIPTNSLFSIAISKNNSNKWFDAYEGIVKFDGINFDFYHFPESLGYDWWSHCIETDYEDNVWIGGSGSRGGETGSLMQYDGEEFYSFPSSEIGLPFERINKLAVDNLNNVWGVTDTGMFKYNGTEWKLYTKDNSDLLENNLVEIMIDNLNNKWILSSSPRLYRLNAMETSFTRYDDLKTYSVYRDDMDMYDMEIDSNNNIWIISVSEDYHSMTIEKIWGNNSELYTDSYSLEPAGWGFKFSSAIDSYDNIWLGIAKNGIRKFDGKNWSSFDHSNMPIADWTSFLEIDEYNNKWIGYPGLLVFNENGIVSVDDNVAQTESLTTGFVLYQNYPNPFNPSTTIKYSTPKQSNVTLKVFDVLGSEVATLVNKEQPQGNYEIDFDGSELTSGIYFYRLKAGEFLQTKKMLMIK